MHKTESEQKPMPVPCRGCVATCPNRAHCEGKPWRLLASAGNKQRAVAHG